MKSLQRHSGSRLIPSGIVAIYALISGIWIYWSDWFVAEFFQNDHDTIRSLATAKGLAFIVLTSTILYLLIRHSMKMIGQSEERFRTLADASFDGVVVSENGRIIDGNEPLARLLDCQLHHLIGRSITEFVSPEDMARVMAAIRTGQESHIEHGIIRPDGSHRIVEAHGRTIRYQDRQVRLTAIRDITQRKQAEQALRESELRLKQSQRVARIGHYVFDILNDLWSSSDMLDEIFGIAGNYNHTAAGWLQIVHPEDRSRLADHLANHVLRDGKPFDSEYRIINLQDGTEHWVHGTGNLEFGNDGRPAKLFGIIQDITDTKRAQEALKESQWRLASILQGTNIGTWEWNVQTGETTFNERWAEMLGYSLADLMPVDIKTWEKLTHPDDLAKAFQMIQRVFARELIYYDCDCRMKHRDGHWVWVQDRGKVAKWTHDGKPLLMTGTHSDISDRKQAEAALQESEQRYRTLFSTLNEGFSLHELICDDAGRPVDYRFLEVNHAFERITGLSRQQCIGRTIRQLLPNIEDLWIQRYGHVALTGRPTQFVDFAASLGRYYEVIAFCPARGKFAVLSLDITDRVRAEEAIRASESRFRELADLLPQAIYESNLAGRLTFANQRLLETFDFNSEDWNAGIHIHDLVVPADHPRISESVNAYMNGATTTGHFYTARRKNGATFPVVVYSSRIVRDDKPQGLRGVIIDISERVRMEEMMIQSEKMLSLGGLAAGVAHEINNPLAGMMQNTQVIAARLSAESPANQQAAQNCGITLAALRAYLDAREIPPMLERTQSAGRRAADIVRNLLSFAYKSSQELLPSSITALIDQTLQIAAMDYDLKTLSDFRTIQIIRDHAPSLPPIPCHPTEIQQVLLNLIRNAAQAMANQNHTGPTPQITLRTRLEDRSLRLDVQDNGPGMSEAIRRRAFEPFFTTKDPGAGTGLGLSVSYFIVTSNHKGRMSVDSSPGNGATFTLWLPLGQETESCQNPTAS